MAPAHDDTVPASGSQQPDSDATLVSRMAAGDQAALAQLYDRWGGRLYSVAFQLLGQRDRAEDVLEDTLWQAWRGAGSYSPARKSVSTWLLTIARRKSLERLRSRGRTGEVAAEIPYGAPDPSFEPSELLSPGAAHSAAFERAIRELPDSERVPFELAFFHGMAVSEIAKRLDQPAGAVATSLRLAAQKIRGEAGSVLPRQGGGQ
jgi:RNA polymerase sigma-70 factor, ECF subfamily